MMVTVHGLPFKTKFQDVKALIKQECNIPDFILDNLVEDGYDSKKVRIGLTTEADGFRLISSLDGFRMSASHVLRVVPVSKITQPQPTFEPRSTYSNQPRNDYSNQLHSYENPNDYNRPNAINPPLHNSPHTQGLRNMDNRHSDRNLMDTRPPPSQAINSRDQYRGAGERRDLPDFRDPKKGPGIPSTVRPESLNPRLQGIDSRQQSDIRNLERTGMRGQDGPIRGPDPSNNRHHDSQSFRSQEGSIRSNAPMRTDGPVRGHEPPIRGTDGPVRGNDGPIRSQDAHVRGHEGPIRGQGGPVRSHDGPLRSHDGAIRGQGGPVRGHDGPRPLDSRIRVRPEAQMRDVETNRGEDFSFPKPDSRQTVSNMEMNHQPQWTGSTDPWANPVGAVQNQGAGFNYQMDNVGYGHQVNSAPQGSFAPGIPQHQNYPAAKPMVSAERPTGRPHGVLRSVEIVDTPIQPRLQPNYPQMQKPITIMKDNFQGPTQYNVGGAASQAPYPGPAAPQPWTQQGLPPAKPQYGKYDERHLADKAPGRHFSPPRGRPGSPDRRSPPRIQGNRPQPYPGRVSPSRPYSRTSPPRHTARFSPRRDISPSKRSPRRMSPGMRTSPTRRLISPTRRVSPRRVSPFRKMSPRKTSPRRVAPTKSPLRRNSPYGRKPSPPAQRNISPFGRKNSPTNQRRISPYRKVSPERRRNSPLGRKASPLRRISPFARKISPTRRRLSPKRDELRRNSPSMMQYDYYVGDERGVSGRMESPRRYSPKRPPSRGTGRYSPSALNYGHDNKDGKSNRSAYDPKQAQKYTGAGFRPNEPQYPSQVQARAEPKIPTWQTDKIVYPSKEESRANPLEENRKKLSPRRSRSRSPMKDRYRRHSPSPRSPRRSWALEKRRSPDPLPPPPPLWPGQVEDKPQRPVWERNPERFEEKRRNEDKFQHTPRFSPRRDVNDFSNKFNDYNESSFTKNPRDEKLFNEVDKDFNDIYQRAVEFRRKTEELRKSNDHRNRFEEPEQRREKKPTWVPVNIQTKELEKERNIRLHPDIKEKRDKACLEIAKRILEPHNFTGEQRDRLIEELKFSVFKIMLELFQDKDVSYIELVIKFRARYDALDEEKILQDVLESMPKHYKNSLKRTGDGISEVPAKISRPSPAYIEDKFRTSGSARLKHNPRKHTLRERDDRIMKRELSSSKSPIRPENRSRRRPFSSPEYPYEKAYNLAKAKRLQKISKEEDKFLGKGNVAKSVNCEKERQSTVETKVLKLNEEREKRENEKSESKPTNEKESLDENSQIVTNAKTFDELSPLMNKIVEDELKNIMIRYWQTLPNKALYSAEKHVLEKFKNEAGDELRNAIGLNITKRLLDVNSHPSNKGLLIKLQMEGAESADDMYDFAKKYDISNLKRITPRIYAGCMRNWADLDALYTVKSLKCGHSKVMVTPVYNFLKCPPMLKTVFDGKQDYATKEAEKKIAKIMKAQRNTILRANKVLAADNKKAKNAEIETKPAAKTESKEKETAKDIKNTLKMGEKAIASKQSQTITTKSQTTEIEVENKTAKTVVKSTEQVPNNPVIIKKELKGEPDKSLGKPPAPTPKKYDNTEKVAKITPEPKISTSTPIISKLVETDVPTMKQPAKPSKPVNVEPEKTINPENNINTNEAKKSIAKESAKTAKDVISPIKKISKPKLTAKELLSKSTVNKPVTVTNESVQPKVTESKVAKTTPVPKSAKTPVKGKTNDNDFDELSDKDILAMLSGGIILDECSGSDEDNK